MFAEILKTFIIVWPVVLIANQVFFFGGAFAPYCLIAAAPHTAIIAAAISYFYNKSESDNRQTNQNIKNKQPPTNKG